jgi:hypothetical protein
MTVGVAVAGFLDAAEVTGRLTDADRSRREPRL